MAGVGDLIGRVISTLVGLAMIAFAAVLAWYIFWAQLESWLATAGALACAAMFGFLGLTLTVTPWRKRDAGTA